MEVTPSDASGPVPLRVRFTARATPSVRDASIARFAWNFDDGTTALGADPTKAFLVPGAYRVRSTVSDSRGNTARMTIPVAAAEGDPDRPAIIGPHSPLPEERVGGTPGQTVRSYLRFDLGALAVRSPAPGSGCTPPA